MHREQMEIFSALRWFNFNGIENIIVSVLADLNSFEAIWEIFIVHPEDAIIFIFIF